jgi:hypothetical protein
MIKENNKENKVVLKQTVDKSLQDVFKYELSRAQIEKLKTLSQLVLALVAAAGIVAVGSVAPNAIKTLNNCTKLRKKFKGLAYDEKQKKMERTFYYLRDSGLVKFHGESSGLKISLTEKAKKLLVKVGFRTATVNKPKVWDKKWWLVAADIPTKEHRLGADQFRAKLKNMNFYFLQKSLWIYPYDPRKEIKFITETYGYRAVYNRNGN